MEIDSTVSELLSSIFYSDISTSSISHIIKTPSSIPSLLTFLLSSFQTESKTTILTHLTNSFNNILFNTTVFQESSIPNNNMNLLKILIHLFLKEDSLQEPIKDLINIIISNTTCDIHIFRYLHDYIKQYMGFENDTYDIFDESFKLRGKLTQKQFLNYLRLLKLLLCQYKYSPPIPNNYFYFGGNSMILIRNNEMEKQLYLQLSSKEYLNIGMWIRNEISSDERKKYFNGKEFVICKINDNKINYFLKLNDNNELFDNKQIFPFQLNVRKWYCIIIQVIKHNENNLKITINVNFSKIGETTIQNSDNIKIKSISFFQNFIGECSSIILYKTSKTETALSILQYKNKPLFEFGLYDENIISPLTYNYSQSYYKNLSLTKEQSQLINASSDLASSLIACFTPTRFEYYGDTNKIFILNDFKCGLIAELKDEINKDDLNIKGVHVYIATHENMDTIGGVVSLLPIIELLTNVDKYRNTIERDILCQQTVTEFIELFWGIMSSKKNLIDAHNNNFFYCLSLFMEQMSTEHFDIAIDGFKQISFSCENSDITDFMKEFYQYLFFNTSLLLKIDYKTLNKVWDHLQIFDYKFIFCFNLSNWCDFILKYDSQHNEYFCCSKHSIIFNTKDNISFNIMEPPLLERLSLFENIIKAGLDEEFIKNKTKVFLTLMKLLTLELSPCMQIFILQLVKYFANKHMQLLLENYIYIRDICKFLIKTVVFDIKLKVYDFMYWIDSNEEKSFLLKENDMFIKYHFNLLLISKTTELSYNKKYYEMYVEKDLVQWIYYINSGKNGYYVLSWLFNLMKYSTENIFLLFKKMQTFQQKEEQSAFTDYLMPYSGELTFEIIDFVFEIFLVCNNSKLNPKFIPSFSINGEEDEKKCSTIKEIGINLFVNAFNKKIIFLQEILAWGKLYQRIFNTNESYQKVLVSFIKTIFDQIIAIKIINNQENDNEYKKEIIILFILYFELASFFNWQNENDEHICNCFKLTVINNQLKGEFINKLTLLEQMIVNIWDNEFQENNTDITINKYIKNAHKGKTKGMYDNVIKLLLTNTSIQNNQSFMNTLFCYYIFVFLSLPNDNDFILEEWLNKLFKYIHFLIIVSGNLKIDNKDKNIYIQFQQKVFDFVVIIYNTFRNELIISKSNKNKYQLILNTLNKILGMCAQIYKIYEKEEKKREDESKLKKGMRLIKEIKSYVVSSKEHSENIKLTAVYKLCNEKRLPSLISDNTSQVQLDDEEEKKRVFIFKEILLLRRQMIKKISLLFDLENKIAINKFDIDKDTILQMIKKKTNLQENEVKISQYKLSLLEEINNSEIERKIQFYEKNQIYKKIKKQLFSFNNVWSCQQLFFHKKHLIKHKRLNHLSKDLTRLMLVPIIDLSTYLPTFSKFQKGNLFFTKENEQHPYIPNLTDLSPIDYSSLKDNNNSTIMEQLKENNISFPMNIYYKSFSHTSNINKDNTNKHKLDYDKVKTYFEKKFEIHSTNSKTIIEECCFVKESYHIKGFCIIMRNFIHFYSFNFDNTNNEEEYDKQRNTCFGSVFPSPKPCDKNCHISFKIYDIEMFLIRRYNFRLRALEIFTKYKKHYYFQFHTINMCKQIISTIKAILSNSLRKIEIINKKHEICIGYINTFNNDNYKSTLNDKYNQWRKWKISTLEFLMYVNVYGNRSFIDTIQYPVAPWPIFDFTSSKYEECLKNKDSFRNFSFPMGMQVYEKIPYSYQRKEEFISLYKSFSNMDDLDNDLFYYGSHFSCQLYVTHYLTRIFPFANIQIELQGSSFDDPNRLFIDIQKTIENTLSLKTDVREIIPEFYCFPEMFYNYNDFNFGNRIDILNNIQCRVNDISLATWSKDYQGKDGYTFVYKFRKILEHNQISKNIHKWIDLIFGNKQYSNEVKSIYNRESYEQFETVFNTQDALEKSLSLRTAEFGLFPMKIFHSSVEKRTKVKHLNNKKSLLDSPLICENILDEIIAPLEIKLCLNKDKINLYHLFKDKMCIYKIRAKDVDYSYKGYIQSKIQMEHYESKKKYIIEKMKSFPFTDYSFLNKSYLDTKPPLKIFNKTNTIVFGGYWSGEIFLINLNKEQFEHKEHKEPKEQIEQIEHKEHLYQNSEKSKITSIEIDSNDSYLACGSKMGFVFIYEIIKHEDPQEIILCEYTILKEQKSEIVDIVITTNLNLLLSLSKEGYAVIYTFPAFKMINMFYVHSIVSKCIISSCPLPCYVFIVNNNRELRSFSINGKLLNEVVYEGIIEHVKMFRDIEFSEYLLCLIKQGNGNCEMEIRNLPYLEKDVKYKRPIFKSNILNLDICENNSFALVIQENFQMNKYEVTVIKEEQVNEEKENV